MHTHNESLTRKLAGLLSCAALSMGLVSGCASADSRNESDNLTANMEFKKVASEFTTEESTALADFSMQIGRASCRERV